MAKKLFLNIEGLVLSAVLTGFIAYEIAAGDAGKKALLFMGLSAVILLRTLPAAWNLMKGQFPTVGGVKMVLWIILLVVVPIGALGGLFIDWPKNFYILGGCAFLFVGPFVYLDHFLSPEIAKHQNRNWRIAVMVHPVMILVGTILGFLKFNDEMTRTPQAIPISRDQLEEMTRARMVDVEGIKNITNMSSLTENQKSLVLFLLIMTGVWIALSIAMWYMDYKERTDAVGQEPDGSSSATAGK